MTPPRWFSALASLAVIVLVRTITAVRGIWSGCGPEPTAKIYFANHTSHGDFVLIWTVMPTFLRRKARPVAGADYWLAGPLRRFFGTHVFKAVLIDRTEVTREKNPMTPMIEALDGGSSLILFPEGTRNTTEAALLPLKSGLYHLAKARPQFEFVPVWIMNLNKVMPKGEFLPIPLLCTVTFGAPLKLAERESKTAFLDRARAALLALAPSDSEPR